MPAAGVRKSLNDSS